MINYLSWTFSPAHFYIDTSKCDSLTGSLPSVNLTAALQERHQPFRGSVVCKRLHYAFKHSQYNDCDEDLYLSRVCKVFERMNAKSQMTDIQILQIIQCFYAKDIQEKRHQSPTKGIPCHQHKLNSFSALWSGQQLFVSCKYSFL